MLAQEGWFVAPLMLGGNHAMSFVARPGPKLTPGRIAVGAASTKAIWSHEGSIPSCLPTFCSFTWIRDVILLQIDYSLFGHVG